MLTYALAVAAPGTALPPGALGVLRDPAPAELPFEPHAHLLWANQSGSVALGAWQDPADEPGAGSRWHRGREGLTAFTGWLWPRRQPWRRDRPWAEQLAEHLREHSLEQGTDELLGVFTAISLDNEGGGTVASDPFGMGLIYLGSGNDLTVISTRADLAARVRAAGDGTAPGRNALGACWVAYSPYPIGSETSFDGVEVVPAGTSVAIDPEAGVELRQATAAPWGKGAARELDRSDALAELRSDIASAIHVAHGLSVEDRLADLTGGKDSRLVLAVMLDEGVADDFEFQTWGRPEAPDARIATQIAELLGLRHEVAVFDRRAERARAERATALEEAGFGELPRRETMMRLTVGSWFGMRNVCEEPQAAAPPDGESVLLSGLCGEALRTNFPRGVRRFGTMKELRRFPAAGLKWGAAGILRPEAAEHYEAEVWAQLRDGFDEDGDVHDAIDAFYLRNRLRRWGGTRIEVDQHNRLFPLYSAAGLRGAFAIGGEARHSEWFHFEITRQACPPLVRVPFDRGGWDPRLLADRPEAAPPVRPVAPAPKLGPTPAPRAAGGGPSEPRGGVVRDRRRRLETTDVEIMRRLLLEDASNPVFDVVDRDAVSAAVDGFEDLHEPVKRQVYGALTAAIWLGGAEIGVRPSA